MNEKSNNTVKSGHSWLGAWCIKLVIGLLLWGPGVWASAASQSILPSAEAASGRQVAGVKSLHSFEVDRVPANWQADDHGQLSITPHHFKDGQRSLQWDWRPGARLTVRDPQGLQPAEGDRDAGLVFWVYNERPVDEPLVVTVGRADALAAGEEASGRFTFHLNFRGWRVIWLSLRSEVALGRRLDPASDTLLIQAPRTSEGGRLFFDAIAFVNHIPWHRTADFQAPYINAARGGGSREYRILAAWQQTPEELPLREPAAGEIAAFERISDRTTAWLTGAHLAANVPHAQERWATQQAMFARAEAGYHTLQIRRGEGRITGRPLVTFMQTREKLELTSFRAVHDGVLGPLALAYHTPPVLGANPWYRNRQVLGWILDLFDHSNDQGWAVGSANGSHDHGTLGICGYAHAVFLMRQELAAAGILERELKTLEWHTRFREIYARPRITGGVNTDDLRTVQVHRLLLALSQPDGPEKLRMMLAHQRWVDAALGFAPGWLDAIKPDFTIYHHRGEYTRAYGENALHVTSLVTHLLQGTPFARSPEALDHLKRAIHVAAIKTHHYEIPLSFSGRWPFNNGVMDQLFPAYAYLALAPSSDLVETGGDGVLDRDLLAWFKRYYDPTQPRITEALAASRFEIQFIGTLGATEVVTRAAAAEVAAAPAPQGHWPFNWGGLSIHRRANWMAAVKGWSRTIWDYEGATIRGENPLGHYLSHGSLLLYAGGDPVTHQSSGYAQQGWDFSRIPGTTVIHLPHPELSRITTARTFTDQVLATGATLDGRNGVYALRLHDTVREPALWASKSYFFFDDVVVALGSDIRTDHDQARTETILYQNALQSPDSAAPRSTRVGEKVWTGLHPVIEGQPGQPLWLQDAIGHGYRLPDGAGVRVVRHHQASETYGAEGGAGDFAVAWIDHGLAPSGAGYEYAVLLEPTEPRAEAFRREPGYRVLERSERAHAVFHEGTGQTAYAIFDPAFAGAGPLVAVSHPSVVILGPDPQAVRAAGTLAPQVLAVVDPDYGWSWTFPEKPRYGLSDLNDGLVAQPTRLPLMRRWWPSTRTGPNYA